MISSELNTALINRHTRDIGKEIEKIVNDNHFLPQKVYTCFLRFEYHEESNHKNEKLVLSMREVYEGTGVPAKTILDE